MNKQELEQYIDRIENPDQYAIDGEDRFIAFVMAFHSRMMATNNIKENIFDTIEEAKESVKDYQNYSYYIAKHALSLYDKIAELEGNGS